MLQLDDATCIPSSVGLDDGRSVSEGSLNTSNEQLALMGFAYQLCTTVCNNDDIADEKSVQKEAELLMSLSCSPPMNIVEQTGRITPQSDSSSCSSSGSKRDSFCFTCPSLSLDNRSKGRKRMLKDIESSSEEAPAVLLGRSLKLADKDALRLSSEAMARNIMQSYKRAIDWRIESWINALSRVLVDKEKSLIDENASEAQIRELLQTGEANLLLKLRELAEKIQVLDGCTSFKVLPQRVKKNDGEESPLKRQRLDGEDGSLELGESEYEYHVTHVMSLVGYLNIYTPAGHAQIDLEVPGTMAGTFLSAESYSEELTDVRIEINTEILAAMIEKSSRMVVRASLEALLKGEEEEDQEGSKSTIPEKKEMKVSTPKPIPVASTPRRVVSSGEPVNKLVVVTPARDTSSPISSYGDSSDDDKPLILPIPNDFNGTQTKPTLQMLTPQSSRVGADRGNFTFASKLKPKKSLPTVVTPGRSPKPEVVARKGPSPVLPLLVEAACAKFRDKRQLSH